MEIPDINIRNIEIRPIPEWMTSPPQALPVHPPVTQQVGVPIIDIPGCVEAHEKSDRNDNINSDDPKGVKVYCDGQIPSFNPIDYNKNKLKFTGEAEVPPVKSPEPPKTEKPVPKKSPPPPKCPTREQELKNPVGKIVEGNKKVTGYEVVGKECLMVTETLSVPDQIILNIPNSGKVTSTASIAVIATTSALLAKPLADLLLRVVRPTTKKIIKKIAKIRGKDVTVESVRDRRDEQRQRSAAIRALRLMKKK